MKLKQLFCFKKILKKVFWIFYNFFYNIKIEVK